MHFPSIAFEEQPSNERPFNFQLDLQDFNSAFISLVLLDKKDELLIEMVLLAVVRLCARFVPDLDDFLVLYLCLNDSCSEMRGITIMVHL
jgi:hypothetical protein